MKPQLLRTLTACLALTASCHALKASSLLWSPYGMDIRNDDGYGLSIWNRTTTLPAWQWLVNQWRDSYLNCRPTYVIPAPYPRPDTRYCPWNTCPRKDLGPMGRCNQDNAPRNRHAPPDLRPRRQTTDLYLPPPMKPSVLKPVSPRKPSVLKPVSPRKPSVLKPSDPRNPQPVPQMTSERNRVRRRNAPPSTRCGRSWCRPPEDFHLAPSQSSNRSRRHRYVRPPSTQPQSPRRAYYPAKPPPSSERRNVQRWKRHRDRTGFQAPRPKPSRQLRPTRRSPRVPSSGTSRSTVVPSTLMRGTSTRGSIMRPTFARP